MLNKHKHNLLLGFIFFVMLFLYLFHITRIPPALLDDEASIAYNAALISKTLHDQNNRFLPVYTLTLNGTDWKQPVNIYTNTLIFKLFGISTLNFKLTSVIFTFLSAFIFYRLLNLITNPTLAIYGTLFYLLNPALYINSRLGLENTSLLPFITLWLYFLTLYLIRKPKSLYLIISGLVLGLSFYSYKGMQVFVWPLYLASLLTLGLSGSKTKLKTLFTFSSTYFLPLVFVPLWKTLYAGAVLNSAYSKTLHFYQIAYRYLSTFNPATLFVTSDKMPIHSTQLHGMFLLAFLPLIILGLSQLKNLKIKPLIIISLILLPLPLTLTDSINRTSRLLVFLPFIMILTTLGFQKIKSLKPAFLHFIYLAVILINFTHFLLYYHSSYPLFLRDKLPPDNLEKAVYKLQIISRQFNLTPAIDQNLYLSYKPQFDFYFQIYFDKNINPILLPSSYSNVVILTPIKSQPNLYTLSIIPPDYTGNPTYYINQVK